MLFEGTLAALESQELLCKGCLILVSAVLNSRIKWAAQREGIGFNLTNYTSRLRTRQLSRTDVVTATGRHLPYQSRDSLRSGPFPVLEFGSKRAL